MVRVGWGPCRHLVAPLQAVESAARRHPPCPMGLAARSRASVFPRVDGTATQAQAPTPSPPGRGTAVHAQCAFQGSLIEGGEECYSIDRLAPMGRRPQRPWQRVDAWSASLAEGAWKRVDVRDGSKGPLVVDVVTRRVVARTPRRQQGDEERLVVLRYRDRDNQQVVKVDFYLSNAEPATPLWQFARVAKAEQRIEECLQRSKSEAGLADYEVRHWT